MSVKDLAEYSGILVYGTVTPAGIPEGLLQLIGKGRQLSMEMPKPVPVSVALIGSGVTVFSKELYEYGADILYCVDDEKLTEYRPDLYIEALETIITTVKPEIVLVLATFQGAEMGSSVAARLETGLAAHCVHLGFNENGYVQVVPAFAGKIFGDIYCPNTRPQMATIKEGMFETPQRIPGREGSCIPVSCELKGFSQQVQLVKSEAEEISKTLDIAHADVVIGGGLGVGSKENWKSIEHLAELLNGAVGCTRPALDQGWVSDERAMIGTSGVVIQPKVYISIGVSGAAHHTCGVKDSALRIAVNHDPEAAIFGSADFGIVEDWENIIPLLTQRIEKEA